MIKSLLIANRGEIACRIIHTARAMGIRTVAVYSDADARALHVRSADEAVHIGPSPAAESYLVGDKIIAAAKASGAEAIHPGYGFLSENGDFAQSVIDAGLVWVGPKPQSIRDMGLKDAAKQRMDAAGVPVTPGYMGENQDPDYLATQAKQIGYPVLIKAVAGGGGKGMRKVDDPAAFIDSLLSCQREAKASFGNAHVLIEKWIESPRHIEVQIFGDSHGNVVHLFERDCSLQRRHQKVIEEAPAPGMDDATRDAICGAAVRAAQAVDYEGAGTIEFIADGSEGLRADRIWFMEMNTRLQVEHPVTEEITGVDLVEWQLRVASGEPIPLRQEELSINGHAIEARLYAEDPAKGFLPSTGPLQVFSLSDHNIRVETGVEQSDEISPFYDPMIAKLVAHGADRQTAMSVLADAMDYVTVWPVNTNAAFLSRLLHSEDFGAMRVTTGWIGDQGDALTKAATPSTALQKFAGINLALDLEEALGLDRHHPWTGLSGMRLNRENAAIIALRTAQGEQLLVDICEDADELGSVYHQVDGQLITVEQGQTFAFSLARHDGGEDRSASSGTILAPMPGKIIAVDVAKDEYVTKGQKLVTLEAMKMEHSLIAPFDGVVEQLPVKVNDQVAVETMLIRIVEESAVD